MAFGFDDEELERAASAPKRRRRWALEIGVAVVLFLVFMIFVLPRLATSRAGLGVLVGGIADATGLDIAFEGVEIDRSGGLWPGTWQADLQGVAVQATEPGVRVEAGSLRLGVEDLALAWWGSDRTFETMALSDVTVTLTDQPAVPEGWAPTEGGPTWGVDEATVVDGSFEVAAGTEVRPGAAGEGIEATLLDVRYTPGTRMLSGNGHATATTVRLGELVVDAPDLTRVVAQASTIGAEGTVGLFGTEIPVKAQAKHVHQGAEVGVVLEVEDLPLERFATTAAGEAAILHGESTGRIAWQSGGELARGEAVVMVEGGLANARLDFGDDEASPKALARLVPTVRVDEQDPTVARLGDLRGKIRWTPEELAVKSLFREGPPQTRVRGPLLPIPELVVRSVQSFEIYTAPGRGAVVERDPEGGWVIRRGQRDELILPPPDKGEKKAPGAPAQAPTGGQGDGAG